MESPTERLRRIMEQKKPRRKWECGMCPSCYQRDACPGGSDGTTCKNYLPPEPTKREWPEIYRTALKKLQEPCDVTTRVHRLGYAKALRDAMTEIHGFTEDEVRGIENDMHSVPGRDNLFSG